MKAAVEFFCRITREISIRENDSIAERRKPRLLMPNIHLRCTNRVLRVSLENLIFCRLRRIRETPYRYRITSWKECCARERSHANGKKTQPSADCWCPRIIITCHASSLASRLLRVQEWVPRLRCLFADRISFDRVSAGYR